MNIYEVLEYDPIVAADEDYCLLVTVIMAPTSTYGLMTALSTNAWIAVPLQTIYTP